MLRNDLGSVPSDIPASSRKLCTSGTLLLLYIYICIYIHIRTLYICIYINFCILIYYTHINNMLKYKNSYITYKYVKSIYTHIQILIHIYPFIYLQNITPIH